MHLVIVLLSNVTEPFRARIRPSTVVPVLSVIDVNAMMVPTKVVPVPSVAELPTCQKTLQAFPPLRRTTRLFDAVVSALGTLKMKTEFGLPWKSSWSVPVTAPVVEKQ